MNDFSWQPWLALLVLLTLLLALHQRPGAARQPLAAALTLALLAAALLALWTLWWAAVLVVPTWLGCIIYQLWVLAVLLFLAQATGVRGLSMGPGLGLLAALGVLALLLPQNWAVKAWAGVNLLGGGLLLLALCYALARDPSRPQAWMVLSAALAGMIVLVEDMHAAVTDGVQSSWAQLLLLCLLLALWLASQQSQAIAAPGAQATHRRSHGGDERRRLAQDLHDGVGSHLISIIAALEAGTPAQRTTAGQLRQCLLELKLLVDGMQEDASLLSLLASLRYRIEPLLLAAQIELQWQVRDEALLEAVRGDAARELLQLAQEALANALHHSRGDLVAIRCGLEAEGQQLLLEIADNGIGLCPRTWEQAGCAGAASGLTATVGKGLSGMRRRVAQLGGKLMLEAGPQQGTCFRVWIPLAQLQLVWS